MNKQFTRTIAGTAILAVGVLALLNALNIANLHDIFRDWWPLVVILVGILVFINHPRQFAWPLAIVAAGVLLQLRELGVLTFSPQQLFWPIVIIAVGLSILVNRSFTHKGVSKKDLDDVTALLSGSTTHSESKNYKGGKVSAIMGGVDIDLRDAVIKDEATINVFAFWGGITLKVPEGWTVKSKITPIAGGVDIKTKPAGSNAPVLYLAGDVVMGGVDVKHL